MRHRFPVRPSSRANKRRQAGLTLVEMSVSLVVLTIAINMTLGAITSFAGLEEANQQKTDAYLAARRMVETLQAAQFGDVLSLYDENPVNDPAGIVVPGPGFAVPSLDAVEGDPDGLAGRVLLPLDAAGQLREDQIDASFGGPRDLNADGIQDALDHSNDYIILPVRVRIEWRSRSGDRFVELQTLLSPR